ncbi:chemotaxis protein CheA [Sphingomonas sp. So64.6b]|uniref:chemotaxis protein CheA n=1 Tax=Sphingomonas sp. So64.6b TaxID=2997354 RepID=UPI0015FFAA5B|nr:chemotaxis protein CheW [Sphingomonas sp. So64.6b]QNA84059.1 chemotaxis protein CheA [Sphingomonas sp. So64.6b]
MDDLLQEFIAETRETLEALSGEIVAWESDPSDRNRLDAIFRFVHTVKGSCGFLDLPRLARLSHAAEDVLAAVRSGTRTPDTSLVNAVLAIVDRIGEIVEAIDAGAALADSGEDLLIAALDEGSEPETVAPAPSALTPRAPLRSVRLNVDLLDRMMSGMSDMVLARNELARRLRDDGVDPAVEAALERLSLTVAEMRDTVTRTRMQKIDALFSALPRMVRDTAAELGKSVNLHIEGADVELDREMIEMMRDPLVHIVRNAIDHGIEAPALRRVLGKREHGRLTVAARQSGNQIIIEIGDDGQGIDTERLIAKIAGTGRSERDLRALSDKARLDLIFEAGLTTKDEVTSISGRGVGMDVVRANIEQIGGRIDLHNNPGKGLRIAIHVPLTLSIISTIGVGVGDQRFAISRQAIEEIVRVGGDAIRIDMLGDTPAATVRERRMPLVDLSGTLGMTASGPPPMLVIVSVVGGSYALAVDAVLDHEELVIKPAAPAVMSTGLYAGQTLPDSGLPMLLLDCTGIATVAGLTFHREIVDEDDIPEISVAERPSALLFDDLDGVRRLVPLSVIDRVEPVSTDAIRFAAGRWRLSIDGRIIPLATQGEIGERLDVSVLRLRDGAMEIGYAIAEALDIVSLPDAIAPAREVGPVAGVVALDDEQIELLDVHWLFATHGEEGREESPPVCLIDGADTVWMTTFLKPVLEGAGYRVATRLSADETAAVVLTMDSGAPARIGAAPVVRLRQDRSANGINDDSIYRYDRGALLAALAERAGRCSGGQG